VGHVSVLLLDVGHAVIIAAIVATVKLMARLARLVHQLMRNKTMKLLLYLVKSTCKRLFVNQTRFGGMCLEK